MSRSRRPWLKGRPPGEAACGVVGPPKQSGPGSPLLKSCAVTLWLFRACLFGSLATFANGSSELRLLAEGPDDCKAFGSEVCGKVELEFVAKLDST